RLLARGAGPPLPLHQRGLAGPPAVRAAARGFPRLKPAARSVSQVCRLCRRLFCCLGFADFGDITRMAGRRPAEGCHGVRALMVQELQSSRTAWGRRTAGALAVSVALASVSPVAAQSLGDRFTSLCGGKSDEPAESKPAPAPGQPAADDDVDCPQVT
ncbi:hypothetical protein KXV85_006067, partial [Aspergillus fumigatus]